MDCYDPSTGQVIAQAPQCTIAEVEEAVAAAAAAFPAWADTPASKRVQVLFRMKALLDQHLDELTYLVAQEHGKVWDEAMGDVLKVTEVVEFACGIPHLMKGPALMNCTTGYDTTQYLEPPEIGPFVVRLGQSCQEGGRIEGVTRLPALGNGDAPHQATVKAQAGELVKIVEIAYPAALGGRPRLLTDDLMHVERRRLRRRDAEPLEITLRPQGRRLDGQERRRPETDLEAEAARRQPSRAGR